jgi:hypothetical protein
MKENFKWDKNVAISALKTIDNHYKLWYHLTVAQNIVDNKETLRGNSGFHLSSRARDVRCTTWVIIIHGEKRSQIGAVDHFLAR